MSVQTTEVEDGPNTFTDGDYDADSIKVRRGWRRFGDQECTSGTPRRLWLRPRSSRWSITRSMKLWPVTATRSRSLSTSTTRSQSATTVVAPAGAHGTDAARLRS